MSGSVVFHCCSVNSALALVLVFEFFDSTLLNARVVEGCQKCKLDSCHRDVLFGQQREQEQQRSSNSSALKHDDDDGWSFSRRKLILTGRMITSPTSSFARYRA
jgi:hypothetical protein